MSGQEGTIVTIQGSRVMRLALLAFSMAWCCGNALAQIPDKINYQGKLTNPAGQPVTATVSMVFSLYDVATGGAALYSENQTAVVTNRVFSKWHSFRTKPIGWPRSKRGSV